MKFALLVRKLGLSNPLAEFIASWQAPEARINRTLDLIAPAAASTNFKTNSVFQNVTYLGHPRRASSLLVSKYSWPLYHYVTIGNTTVTGTCWIRPTRPLSTITLVAHPWGENHELVISYPSHKMIYCGFLLPHFINSWFVESVRFFLSLWKIHFSRT